ncbi:MAG: hypothetical protein JWR18_1088, partial [Segetibacter sp.]|nr:hypothetical protein [Segetibacter sp.]
KQGAKRIVPFTILENVRFRPKRLKVKAPALKGEESCGICCYCSQAPDVF